MKIKITRAFKSTIQLKQFEPIQSFCAAEVELGVDGTISSDVIPSTAARKEWSDVLDQFCRAEVEKTLNSEIAKHNLIASKGKSAGERKEIAKDTAEHEAGDF